MEHASNYSMLVENPEESCDTNILFLNFEAMKSWRNFQSKDDPNPCSFCYSVQNSFNQIYNFDDIPDIPVVSSQIKPKLISSFHLDANDPKQPKQKKMPPKKKPILELENSGEDFYENEKNDDDDVDGTPKAILWKTKNIKTEIRANENSHNLDGHWWTCEFCGNINEIPNSNAEPPKNPDLFYILDGGDLEGMNNNDDISVIFCLDNSGSMSASLEVDRNEGLTPGNLNQKELDQIKQAISPAEYNELVRNLQHPNQKGHITRKNCIIKAIQKELNKMRDEFPRRKVGIVIFNDDVTIAGDGQTQPKFIMGNNLLNYGSCLKIGQDSKHLMKKNILENCGTVINSYTENPEKGKTALGPALLASVGLASTGKPGSMVVLCTDGLANVGIGDLTINDISQNMVYENIGKFASESGININIITIVGEQSRSDILVKLVEKTNGNIERVNPSVISNEFREMLNDNILARKAIITIYLPSYLRFIDEDVDTLSEGGSVCRKSIGNVSENTRVSMRYKVKNYVFERRKKKFKENMKICFQAQMKYLSLEGIEILRVINAKFPATFSQDTAFLNGNVALIANHAASEIVRLHSENRIEEQLEKQNKWNLLMERIREVKRNKHRLEESEEVSMNIFRRDSNMMDDITVKRLNRKKGKAINKLKPTAEIDDEVQNDEESTFVFKLKKKNYK